MNTIAKSGTTKPAFIITAVLVMLIGVLIVSPTVDLLTLLIRIAITIVPLLVLLFLFCNGLRRGKTLANFGQAIGIGAGIGVAAVVLSEVVLRAISALAA